MEVKFADSFFESIKKINVYQRWYWKTWDFFRYDLVRGIKNIFFFWRVIWNFRPWDYNYQLKIFARSLEPLHYQIEHYGMEVDVPRLKKVAAIKRTIEILNNQIDDNYLEFAEKQLGFTLNTSYGIFGDKQEEDEPIEISENNSKLFNLSNDLCEKEWVELFHLLKGQDYTHYKMLCDRAKKEDFPHSDLWEKWFDGSGIRGWWD